MRILLISDIHANWPALQALAEPCDLCICLGDVVDYGLEPAPCIDWLRQRAQLVVRGNHDHGAAQNVVVKGERGFKYLTAVTRPLTRERLGPMDLRYLADMPVSRMATFDDLRFLLVHATPRDPLDEYSQADADFWSRRLERVEADIVCVGHTHHPYVLEADGKLVINPGSIGLPRDGDPRAAYAVVQGRNVELKRYEYPIETTVQRIQESSLPEPAKEMLACCYRTGGRLN